MKRVIFGVLVAVAAGAVAAAQLYRWVDDKGRVEWRDPPPPKSAKNVEKRNITGSTIETSTPSYSAQLAAKNFPVTLWAYDCGDPCKDARALLARRGVPYTEKDPRSDLKAFEKLTGSTNVPVLYVGSNKVTGYLASTWNSALDNAGYPQSATPGAKPPAPPPAAAQESGQPAAKGNGNEPPQPPAAPAPQAAGK